LSSASSERSFRNKLPGLLSNFRHALLEFLNDEQTVLTLNQPESIFLSQNMQTNNQLVDKNEDDHDLETEPDSDHLANETPLRKANRPVGSILAQMEGLAPYEPRTSYHQRFQ